MNREEFLVKASAYIGVAVGMRDNEMCIDGPHVIIEMANNEDSLFIQTPERTDFLETENGDWTICYEELVKLTDEARIDFDKNVLALRAEIAEHLAAINPALQISVLESVEKCHPKATFFLHDTGVALYAFTMYGEHAHHEAHNSGDGWSIRPEYIHRRKWPTGETGSMEVDENGFAMCDDIQGLLGSNIRYNINEFITTIITNKPLPNNDTYRELTTPRYRKFVDFEVL
jgi:hypothetical protein